MYQISEKIAIVSGAYILKEGHETVKDYMSEEAEEKTFPDTPEEMDDMLGTPGDPVPDGPTTQGRNKTKWKTGNGDVEVVNEGHPYDADKGAPASHTEPHWHVYKDGKKLEDPNPTDDNKESFPPGSPIPSEVFDGVN